MTNGMQTIARSLADAAQALGAEAVSALAAELAARQAAPKAGPEGDFSRTSFAASLKRAPTVTATISAEQGNWGARRVAAIMQASHDLHTVILDLAQVRSRLDASQGPILTETNGAEDFESTAARIRTAFDISLIHEAAKAAGASRAERTAEVEPGKVHHVAAGDRVGFIHGSPFVKGKEGGRPARASTVENDAATGTVEGITISHPLFDITIKPRG